MNQLKEWNINPNLSQHLASTSREPEVIIHSMCINDLNDIKEHIERIRAIKADFIILQVEDKFVDYELMKNIFKYGENITWSLPFGFQYEPV